jgi:AcrR family transcriptional regulator
MQSNSKAGRKPKVSREQIARSALSLGLENATIRSVAKNLRMSVPGLYHHVRTREDLLALAFEYATPFESKLDHLPSLGAFLEAYARKVYASFVEHPTMVSVVASGDYVHTGYPGHFDWFLVTAGEFGLTHEQAYAAMCHLVSATIGAAMIEAGDRAMEKQGHSPASAVLAYCAEIEGDGPLPACATIVQRPQLSEDRFASVQFVIDAIVRQYAALDERPTDETPQIAGAWSGISTASSAEGKKVPGH